MEGKTLEIGMRLHSKIISLEGVIGFLQESLDTEKTLQLSFDNGFFMDLPREVIPEIKKIYLKELAYYKQEFKNL